MSRPGLWESADRIGSPGQYEEEIGDDEEEIERHRRCVGVRTHCE